MERVDIDYAREHLAELMERAARGEDVLISDLKIGTMRLSPTGEGACDVPASPARMPGLMRGKFSLPDDKLFAPLSDDELAWLSGYTSISRY